MVVNARNFFGLAVAQSLVAGTYLRARNPQYERISADKRVFMTGANFPGSGEV